MSKKPVWFHSRIDLQAERAKAGLTQQQLADKAGCHVQTVRNLEAGKGGGQGDFLQSNAAGRIASALDLEPLGHEYIYPENRNASREANRSLWGYGEVFSWMPREPKEPAPEHRYCDARRPNGKGCKKKPVSGARRCRGHGGLSTGPITQAGVAAISKAQIARHQAAKERAALPIRHWWQSSQTA